MYSWLHYAGCDAEPHQACAGRCDHVVVISVSKCALTAGVRFNFSSCCQPGFYPVSSHLNWPIYPLPRAMGTAPEHTQTPQPYTPGMSQCTLCQSGYTYHAAKLILLTPQQHLAAPYTCPPQSYCRLGLSPMLHAVHSTCTSLQSDSRMSTIEPQSPGATLKLHSRIHTRSMHQLEMIYWYRRRAICSIQLFHVETREPLLLSQVTTA
jgi:hypothetical protein